MQGMKDNSIKIQKSWKRIKQILEVKSLINQIKNSGESLSSKMDQIKHRIAVLEDMVYVLE
jgi:hypothetical protein